MELQFYTIQLHGGPLGGGSIGASFADVGHELRISGVVRENGRTFLRECFYEVSGYREDPFELIAEYVARHDTPLEREARPQS